MVRFYKVAPRPRYAAHVSESELTTNPQLHSDHTINHCAIRLSPASRLRPRDWGARLSTVRDGLLKQQWVMQSRRLIPNWAIGIRSFFISALAGPERMNLALMDNSASTGFSTDQVPLDA